MLEWRNLVYAAVSETVAFGHGGSTPPSSTMYTVRMIVCKTCGEAKDEKKFNLIRGGPYRRHTCFACHARVDYRNNRERLQRYAKIRRQTNPSSAIYVDSRKSDKKHGRENDLTKEFIAVEIAKGCSYCGETKLRMTLDRIDNGRGHLMDNVVPACVRCNYTRKDMPYEAWIVVAPGMREAREQGLFGDWNNRVR